MIHHCFLTTGEGGTRKDTGNFVTNVMVTWTSLSFWASPMGVSNAIMTISIYK